MLHRSLIKDQIVRPRAPSRARVVGASPDRCRPARSALVWGTSAKHAPQKVGKDHVLDDEDVVQIIKK